MSIRTPLLSLLLAGTALGTQAAEPVLNLYSARHYQTDEALYSDFTQQTGIKINRIEGKEEELMERIRNEGANSPADVFLTVDAARLAQADALGRPTVNLQAGATGELGGELDDASAGAEQLEVDQLLVGLHEVSAHVGQGSCAKSGECGRGFAR